MSKTRLFLENFLIYGLGGIINKLVPFFMLPIITRLMPSPVYFGLNEITNTIAQFGSALAIMGIYDAVFRLFFDKDEEKYQKTVCSTALMFLIVTTFMICGIILLFQDSFAILFFDDIKYKLLLYLSVASILSSATNSIIAIPSRLQNKRMIFVSFNFLSSVISYGIAIPLLLNGHYLVALPLAAVISALCIEASFYYINKKWFDFSLWDKKILKQLLMIGVPLLPTFLIYWVLNSCDRIMLLQMMGAESVGIYSLGAKIASASHLIYTAFAGGWQYFAFSTMNEKDQVKNNSLVFEYLGVISFVTAAYVFVFSKTLFKLFFTEDYLSGYLVAPYLFLGPLMLMLYQVIGNQFLVIKKTWPSMVILAGGSIVNVVLNFVLIPIIGIEGAAIATLLGYLVAVIICSIVLCRMNLMVISKRIVVVSILLLIYILSWRFYSQEKIIISFGLAVLYSLISMYLYRQDIRFLLDSIRKR